MDVFARRVGSIAFFVVAGCSGGSGDGGAGVRITPARFGGSIRVSAGPQRSGLEGEFISGGSCTPSPQFYGLVPTDKCVLTSSASCTSSWTYLDAGTYISATSGTTTLTANRGTLGDAIFYAGVPVSGAPEGADYAVSAAGSTDIPAGVFATIHVPQKVTISSGSTYTPGQPWTLNMAGADDADAIVIRLSNNSATYSCATVPGSSFTIPAEVTADLGSSPLNITSASYTAATLTLHDRDMLLLGIAY